MDNPFSSMTAVAPLDAAVTMTQGRGRKKFDWEVLIDPARIRLLMDQADLSPVVTTSIHYMVSQVISSGVKVQMRDGSQTWEPNESLQQWIEEEFAVFVEEAISKAYQLGFFVWSLIPSRVIPGWPSPVLLRDHSYSVKKVWKGDKPMYRVYRMRTQRGDFMRGTTGQTLMMQDPAKDAWVTPVGVWKPDDRGRLQSPVANALKDVISLNVMWQEFIGSVRHFAHPTLMFDSVETAASKSVSPYEDGVVTAGDMSRVNHEYDAHTNAAVAAEQELALFRAKMHRIGMRVDFDPVTQRQRVAPESELYDNQYNTPIGSKFSHAVTPAAIPDFLKINESLVTRIVDVIGVPPMYRFAQTTSGIGSASVADLAIRNFNDRIKRTQAMFRTAMTSVLRKMLNATVVKRNEGAMQGMVADVRKVLVGQARSELLGEDSVARGSLTPQPVDQRSLRYNLERASKVWVEAFQRVEVTFEFTPLTTLDSLRKLHQDMVISSETYARSAIRITGLQENRMLDDEERMQEIKRRRKEQEAATMQPLPPDAAAPRTAPRDPRVAGERVLNPRRSDIAQA